MEVRKILVALTFTLTTEIAAAYDCIEYAQRASAQSYAQAQLSCGYSGARWNLSQQFHLDWCMAGNLEKSKEEDLARRDGLKYCLNQTPTILNCNQYADLAGGQNAANVTLHCGLVGNRWSGVWDVHRDWCKGVFYNIDARYLIDSEDRARRDALKICVDR